MGYFGHVQFTVANVIDGFREKNDPIKVTHGFFNIPGRQLFATPERNRMLLLCCPVAMWRNEFNVIAIGLFEVK